VEKFNQILNIRWGMLDVAIHRLDPAFTNRFVWFKLADDVGELVAALSTLRNNHPALLNFQKLKTSLDLILVVTDLSSITVTNGGRRLFS